MQSFTNHYLQAVVDENIPICLRKHLFGNFNLFDSDNSRPANFDFRRVNVLEVHLRAPLYCIGLYCMYDALLHIFPPTVTRSFAKVSNEVT